MARTDAIELTTADGVTAVIVHGDFDPTICDEFITVASQGRGPVEVDLSDVTFLDSAGLRALVTVAKAVRHLDRSFRVVHVAPPARRVIEICALEEYLGLEPSTAN